MTNEPKTLPWIEPGSDEWYELDHEERDHRLAQMEEDPPEEPDSWEDACQADAEVLASAGMGTDEDYGMYVGEDI